MRIAQFVERLSGGALRNADRERRTRRQAPRPWRWREKRDVTSWSGGSFLPDTLKKQPNPHCHLKEDVFGRQPGLVVPPQDPAVKASFSCNTHAAIQRSRSATHRHEVPLHLGVFAIIIAICNGDGVTPGKRGRVSQPGPENRVGRGSKRAR